MRETVKKIVDGEEYEFSQMGAKESLRILTRLAKILGKPIAIGMSSLESSPGKGFLDQNLDGTIIAQAVEALVSSLDENEVLSLCETLCANTCLCNGQKVVFNSHYENRLGHLFKVLKAALEVQYGNFFGVLTEMRGASRAPAPSTAQEPQA